MAEHFREPDEEVWNRMTMKWFWLLWAVMISKGEASAEMATETRTKQNKLWTPTSRQRPSWNAQNWSR